jgi:glycosyltransferase involved in cell wall biosynthesis
MAGPDHDHDAVAAAGAELDVSIVVPLYNEVDSIAPLHAQITAAMASTGRSWELVFIDDGSRDGSGPALDALAASDPHVAVVHFRRNFGKSPALAAGFERTRGAVVFTLDADLQDDPAMIPAFLARIDAGADLVSGWKQQRHDPLGKTLPSKLFNAVVRWVSGLPLHDFNCGFKAYTRACVQELAVYGGFHRFMPVLAHERGFRIEELVVQHRPRLHGVSKFGARRFFDGLLDLMTVLLTTRYRTRPLHFFGLPGAALVAVGLALLAYLTGLWVIGEPIGTRPLLTLGVLCTVTGFQFLGIGLVAELLVRTTVRSREIFSIRGEQGAAAAAELRARVTGAPTGTSGEPPAAAAPAPHPGR